MGAVHHQLVDMGKLISCKFKLDNLHILGPERNDDQVLKILDAVNSLKLVVKTQHDTIDQLFEKIAELRTNVTDVHEASHYEKRCSRLSRLIFH